MSKTSVKPLSVKGVLFDLDGTLVDSTLVVERQWHLWGARHGIDALWPDESVSPVGRTRPTIIELAPDGDWRVIRPGGKLFHYTGSPNKLTSGRDVPREVARRLENAGFKAELALDGVLATKR